MAGETTLMDLSFDNVNADNIQPYQVVILDVSNSSPIITAAKLPAATAGLAPLGVSYDKSKLDPAGNVVTTSGVNVRVLGVARVAASAAVTPGAYVGTSGTTAGRVAAQAQTAGGSQPKPVLGIAWTQAASAADRIVVLLTPGVVY